MTQYINKHSL